MGKKETGREALILHGILALLHTWEIKEQLYERKIIFAFICLSISSVHADNYYVGVDFYPGIGIRSAAVDLVTDVVDGDGSPRIRNFVALGLS